MQFSCDYLLIIKYDEHSCSSQKSKNSFKVYYSPLSDRAQTRLNYKGVVIAAACSAASTLMFKLTAATYSVLLV